MSFMEHFAIVDDPRKNINVKHDLLDVLFLTVSAVISGAECWKDIEEFGLEKLDWLWDYRLFTNGIPVDDTIARIVPVLDPAQFNQAFINWVNAVPRDKGQGQIAIDGKTLRHSYDGEKLAALHSITAWSRSQGLILAQMKSSGKKNENASVLTMLDSLNINGAHITADAMNSQQKIVSKVRKGCGDYTLCIKGNHKHLREEIKAYFHKMKREDDKLIAIHGESNGGHGRVEKRVCRQLRVSEWITKVAQWEGVQTIIEVERERHFPDQSRQQDTQ